MTIRTRKRGECETSLSGCPQQAQVLMSSENLVIRDCLSTGICNGKWKVTEWVKLHEISSCKGVGQIPGNQRHFSMISAQGEACCLELGFYLSLVH